MALYQCGIIIYNLPRASRSAFDQMVETLESVFGFCFAFVIDMLMEKYKDIAVKLDGRDSEKQKHTAETKFMQEENTRLFIGNIQAAGKGLNLTAASNVAFIEYPFSPGDLDQSADRCHRIGQKDTVNVYYLHGSGTIEEKLIRILDRKKLILDSLLDGKDTSDEDLLTELLKLYK